MSIAKHKHEATERRVFEALENWYLNEALADVTSRAELTRVELTTDKRHLTVYFLPASGEDPEEVHEELLALEHELRDILEDALSGRRPELRLRLDRGAQNAARVEAILDELSDDAVDEESGRPGA